MSHLKIPALLVSLLAGAVLFVQENDVASARPPTGDWAICVSQNWPESDCGYYELFLPDGTSQGVAIGGTDVADGWWNCAGGGVNGCRAVKIRSIAPTYVTESPTTTAPTSSSSSVPVSDGGSSSSSSSSSVPVSDGGSSSSSTTTVASPPGCQSVCGYAVVDEKNFVYGVIVCSETVCGTGGSWGGRMPVEYMGCPAGCRLILQTQASNDGNVAGWHGQGVRYEPGSASFSLPGGGSIRSGGKIEEAQFPTTTSSTSTSTTTTLVPVTTTTEPLIEVARVVETQTQVVISEEKVSFEIPTTQLRDADFSVTFDPSGPSPAVVLLAGRIQNGVLVEVVEVQRSTSDGQEFVGTEHSAKIEVNKSVIAGLRGRMKVALTNQGKMIATYVTEIREARRYSDCRSMRRDYPFGVSALASSRDKNPSLRPNSDSGKPVRFVRTYFLNKRLDRDNDKIACERS